MLWTATSIKQLGQNQTSSKGLWDALITALGTPGPAVLFADFKTATFVQINPQNPILDITKMSTIFERLTSNAVAIPEIVKTMILIAAIPCKFDHLSSHLLQVYTTATLTFNIVSVRLRLSNLLTDAHLVMLTHQIQYY